MTITYDELHTLTQSYKKERELLAAKLVAIPASLEVFNTSQSTSLVQFVQDLNNSAMPEEAKEAHQEAVNALQKFQNIMVEHIAVAKFNNYNVSMEMRALYANYLKATDIPERKFKSALLINKQNIDKEDHAAIVEIYKVLKLTHYSTHKYRDIVYYNPDETDFDTMKNLLLMHLPSALQFKYPLFWSIIHDSPIDNDPLTGCFMLVMTAKQA